MTTPQSERLTYRLACETDAPFLRLLEDAPGVREFVGTLATDARALGPDRLLFLVSEGPVPVGLAGFVPSDLGEGGEFQLVCSVAKKARCRGFGSEATAALLRWAWATQPWPRVLAFVNRANARGLALAKSLGFIDQGPRPFEENVLVLERLRGKDEAAQQGDEADEA